MEFVVSKIGKTMLLFDGLKYVFGQMLHEKLPGQYF
jgi:hypothetical protein